MNASSAGTPILKNFRSGKIIRAARYPSQTSAATKNMFRKRSQ